MRNKTCRDLLEKVAFSDVFGMFSNGGDKFNGYVYSEFVFCRNFVVLLHFKHLNILDNVSNIC